MLGKKAALSMSLGLLFYTYGSGALVSGHAWRLNVAIEATPATELLATLLPWCASTAQEPRRAVVSSHILPWT